MPGQLRVCLAVSLACRVCDDLYTSSHNLECIFDYIRIPLRRCQCHAHFIASGIRWRIGNQAIRGAIIFRTAVTDRCHRSRRCCNVIAHCRRIRFSIVCSACSIYRQNNTVSIDTAFLCTRCSNPVLLRRILPGMSLCQIPVSSQKIIIKRISSCTYQCQIQSALVMRILCVRGCCRNLFSFCSITHLDFRTAGKSFIDLQRS